MSNERGLAGFPLLVPADFAGALNVRHDQTDSALPLSVADMDFQAPRAVVAAVVERARQGAYGYTYVPDEYRQCVSDWLLDRHGWAVAPDQMILTSRAVEAVPVLLRTLTNAADPVVVPTPAYGPISSAIAANDRRAVWVPLAQSKMRYSFDADSLRMALSAPTTSRPVLILTNPHNPTGRVFAADELLEVAKAAEHAGALIVSDDVHADLLYRGQKYVPISTVSDYARSNTITFTSPGKSFNLAGLESVAVVIENPELRKTVHRALLAAGFHNPAYFAVAASQAAYQQGTTWLGQLLTLVQQNFEKMRAYIAEHQLGIHMSQPEGTYLVWLDLRSWGLNEALLTRVLDGVGLELSMGSGFGEDYQGFARINIATTPAILREALRRLSHAHATVRNNANTE